MSELEEEKKYSAGHESKEKSTTPATIFSSSTISYPNADPIMRAAAAFLKTCLTDASNIRFLSTDSELFLFSEEAYIAENPEDFD